MPELEEAGGGADLVELEHAIGYNSMRKALHYHPNGRNYVYSAGASVVVADFTDPHQQAFLHGHDEGVCCLALSRMGNWIASGQMGENADVMVWSFEGRELVYQLQEHDHGISTLAFSDDEKLLVTAGVAEDGKMIVWDMCNGYIVTTVSASPRPTTFVSFGGFTKNVKRRPTSNYQLLTAGANKMVMWSLDPYTGEIAGEPITAEGRGTPVRDITHAVFSDDFEWVYCATATGDFLVVRVSDLKTVRQVGGSRRGLNAILAWPEGVITGAGDGTICAYDASLNLMGQRRIPGGVHSLSFSADRLEILVGGTDGHVFRVRQDALTERGAAGAAVTAEDEKLLLLNQNPTGRVTCVAYAPGASDRFATGSTDGCVRVWDANDYSVAVEALVRDAGAVNALIYSADMIISGWDDGRIRSHDSYSGEALWAIDNAHQGAVTALVMSNNTRYIMSGGDEGAVRIWELRSRDLVSHLKEHRGRVSSICLFDDDVHALSASRDRSFLCWDLRQEKRITSHAQRMGGLNCIALPLDQARILTVGQERRVTVWDLREREPIQSRDVGEPGDEAKVLAMSNSGKIFATGGTGKQVRIWNTETLEPLQTLVLHSATVNGLTFSPDDRQLVSVGDDGCIAVWNVFDVEL